MDPGGGGSCSPCHFKGGGVLVEKLFCSFFNPDISLYIYYDQYEKIWREKKFPRLVSMEMAAIFDFRPLTKVYLTSKPLLQMKICTHLEDI